MKVEALSLDFVSHYPEWHHVLFTVKDADNSIRFYSDYLGMAAVQDQRDSDGKRWVSLRFAENPYAPLFVLVEDTPAKKGPSAAASSLKTFCFRLLDLKPVEEISAKAKAAGCLVEASQYGGNLRGYFCVVSDPDGNLMEFSHVIAPKTGGN